MTHRSEIRSELQRARLRRHARLLRSLALAAGLTLPACSLDEILSIEDPDAATPASLEGKDALPALLAGAIGDLQVGYAGDGGSTGAGEGIVNYGGLLADEFISTESFPTRVPIDQRDLTSENPSVSNVYLLLHVARAAAERAAAQFAEFEPNSAGHATALAFAGFSYIALAENFCSGIPVSTLAPSGATEFGDPLSTVQLFERAIERFDAALGAAPATAATQRHLATVGKARALLNLGRPAEAGTLAVSVPAGFVFFIEHSANTVRQENGVFQYVNLQERWGVADVEGGNGLAYRSSADSRTRFRLDPGNGLGFDGTTPIFHQLKYPGRADNVVLASTTEARLIQAEAELKAGRVPEWLALLNGLRAAGGLSALADPGSAPARLDLTFRERGFWLWLTGHRLGDLRRLIRDYGRAAASVFPTGNYHKGGVYGPDVSFPLPAEELNNPKA
ncbi:MAG: hypothetical protein ACREON_13665, partial [Gemmatimonadaceae bacterium]